MKKSYMRNTKLKHEIQKSPSCIKRPGRDQVQVRSCFLRRYRLSGLRLRWQVISARSNETPRLSRPTYDRSLLSRVLFFWFFLSFQLALRCNKRVFAVYIVAVYRAYLHIGQKQCVEWWSNHCLLYTYIYIHGATCGIFTDRHKQRMFYHFSSETAGNCWSKAEDLKIIRTAFQG